MDYEYLELSSNSKRQVLKKVFEEFKKNQNYEVDFETNGLSQFTGNAVSDKEIFLAALKYKFALSKSEFNYICEDLVLNQQEVSDLFSLFKRDLEPTLNKWFNDKAIAISSEENIKFEDFNVNVEETANELLDKSTIENQINNLTYLLAEYSEVLHHYDQDHSLHIEYVFSEYELFKFVREYISPSLPFEDFIKQLMTIEFTPKDFDEPIVILQSKLYVEEEDKIFYVINNKIVDKLISNDDEDEDEEDGFGSLF